MLAWFWHFLDIWWCSKCYCCVFSILNSDIQLHEYLLMSCPNIFLPIPLTQVNWVFFFFFISWYHVPYNSNNNTKLHGLIHPNFQEQIIRIWQIGNKSHAQFAGKWKWFILQRPFAFFVLSAQSIYKVSATFVFVKCPNNSSKISPFKHRQTHSGSSFATFFALENFHGTQTKHRIKNQSEAVCHRHKAHPNLSSTENIANVEVQAETYYFHERITIKKIYLRKPRTM